jgi:hypothetical protein
LLLEFVSELRQPRRTSGDEHEVIVIGGEEPRQFATYTERCACDQGPSSCRYAWI